MTFVHCYLGVSLVVALASEAKVWYHKITTYEHIETVDVVLSVLGFLFTVVFWPIFALHMILRAKKT